jgi:hypothetical protein
MTVVLALPVKVVTKVWRSVGSLTPDKAAWSFELRLDQVGDHDSVFTAEMSLTRFLLPGPQPHFFSVRKAGPLPLRASVANRYNLKTHMAALISSGYLVESPRKLHFRRDGPGRTRQRSPRAFQETDRQSRVYPQEKGQDRKKSRVQRRERKRHEKYEQVGNKKTRGERNKERDGFRNAASNNTNRHHLNWLPSDDQNRLSFLARSHLHWYRLGAH